MKIVIVFLVTFIASFVGSLQLGPVNVAVIRTTIRHNLRTGLWLACGGCLPEIIYGFLALHGVMFFENHPHFFKILQWSIVPVLLVAGIMLFLKKKQTVETKPLPKSHKVSLSEGFILAILNPQLIAFWTVILVNYKNYPTLKIDDVSSEIAFLIGTSAGAFGILYFFARLAHKQRQRIFKRIPTHLLNQITGGLFLLIGFAQLLKLIL